MNDTSWDDWSDAFDEGKASFEADAGVTCPYDIHTQCNLHTAWYYGWDQGYNEWRNAIAQRRADSQGIGQ